MSDPDIPVFFWFFRKLARQSPKQLSFTLHNVILAHNAYIHIRYTHVIHNMLNARVLKQNVLRHSVHNLLFKEFLGMLHKNARVLMLSSKRGF